MVGNRGLCCTVRVENRRESMREKHEKENQMKSNMGRKEKEQRSGKPVEGKTKPEDRGTSRWPLHSVPRGSWVISPSGVQTWPGRP